LATAAEALAGFLPETLGPIGDGPVHGPSKALRVDKGFQQQHAMTESGFPIAPQTPLAERQHPRPQVENMPLGQDEKTAVVDHQLQAAIALAKIPTDPAIARGALEGTGRKAQQGHPFLPPGGDIPQRFADLRQGPQVVVLLHQLLITGLFEGTNRPDHDLAKVQAAPPSAVQLRLSACSIGEDTASRLGCPEEVTNI